ncbi:hypothetical protein [Pedobacter miscanthi]|uniref:hypothetical protein n=1 Tax=Pedobacter miscanthi TaxID=2259170 RepID=UPI002931AF18|nr:hypothetical protein [Pedobacter miscanthi]
MMDKTRTLILIFITILFISCSHQEKISLSTALSKAFPLIYQTVPLTVTNFPVTCDYQLRAKNTGDTLLLSILVNNDTSDPVTVNLGDIQIMTGTDIKSDVIDTGYHRYVIDGHSHATLTFKFSPVHNEQLYETTDYKGDLDMTYYLNTDFLSSGGKKINQPGGKVKFQVDRHAYSAYRSKFAIQPRIRTYVLNNRTQIRQDIITSLNQHHRIDPEEVRINNNIISVGGLIIKFKLYRLDSTVHLHLQVINHGLNEIKINPQRLKIRLKDSYIFPQVSKAENTFSFKRNDDYYIVRGGRFEARLEYPVKVAGNLIIVSEPVWLAAKLRHQDRPVELNFNPVSNNPNR